MRAGAGERTSSRCAGAAGLRCADPPGHSSFQSRRARAASCSLPAAPGCAAAIDNPPRRADGGQGNVPPPLQRPHPNDLAYLAELRAMAREKGRSAARAVSPGEVAAMARQSRRHRPGAARAAARPSRNSMLRLCGPAAMVADVPPMLAEALGIRAQPDTARRLVILGIRGSGLPGIRESALGHCAVRTGLESAQWFAER